MNWRSVTDFAKKRDWPLKIADRLGRGRGRLRVLDRLNPPPRAPLKPDLSGWESHALAAVWIGHATVLLRVGQQTIITDPVFSTRIGLGLGLATAGPRRHYLPALNLHELPKLDAILLSHAHFDHLDRPTLARLSKSVTVIASAGLCDLIADLGFKRIIELDWNESFQLNDVKITAQPARHWGARTFLDSHRGFGAFLIESPKHRILYGGDSAYHEDWKPLAPIDLAILGIGAYDPYIATHASPEQAWEMAQQMQANYVLPMHHSTFKLSHEPMHEPIERMLRVAGSESHRVVIQQIGGRFTSGTDQDAQFRPIGNG